MHHDRSGVTLALSEPDPYDSGGEINRRQPIIGDQSEMKLRESISLVPLLCACLLPCPSSAEEVFLFADFNDKAINEPIGHGGAEFGEPTEVYTSLISAIVRSGPMGTPSLEIRDISDFGAGFAVFEFLGGTELTTGIVSVSADLWFHDLSGSNRFLLYVRENGSASERFGDLRFNPDGAVSLFDHQGYVGVIGSYVTEKRFRIIMEFDMEAGTYDVWLDGTLAINGREHGVTERGIGSVIIGCDHDEDLEGFFNVDALTVTDYFQEVPVGTQSWGRIKAGYLR